MSHVEKTRRVGIVTAAAAVIFAAGTAPAWAHVTVHADTTTTGGYAKLTFRVPTERDDASTTKLLVSFPTNTPLASVSVQPHPGWKASVRTEKLKKPVATHDGKITEAVNQITWTANSPADAIKPGEFDEFNVSAGPLPAPSTLTFPALQTYSSGEVVRWIETAASGAPEPEHPAPTLTVTPDSPKTQTVAKADSTDSGGTSTIGIIALIVAVIAAGLSIVNFARR